MVKKKAQVNRDLLQYAVCRTIAHGWEPWTVDTDRKGRTHLVTLRCPRCDTYKSFLMNADTGLIIKRYGYHYPEPYLKKGGLSDAEKAAMNLAFVDQVKE